jgi:hypothetical protein
VRAVIVENLLLKQPLIVLRRARQRAPNLTRGDRLLCGFWALFLSPERIRKVALAIRPSMLLGISSGVGTSQGRPSVLIEAVPQEARTDRAG